MDTNEELKKAKIDFINNVKIFKDTFINGTDSDIYTTPNGDTINSLAYTQKLIDQGINDLKKLNLFSNVYCELPYVNYIGCCGVRYYLTVNGTIATTGLGASYANGDLKKRKLSNLIEVNCEDSTTFKKIFAGGKQLFALDKNGIIYSMGSNSLGQLGHGNFDDVPQLTKINFFVTNNITIERVIPAPPNNQDSLATYFIDTNKALYGVGINTYGNLGIGNVLDPQSTPIKIADNVLDICITNYPYTLFIIFDNPNNDIVGIGYANAKEIQSNDQESSFSNFTNKSKANNAIAMKANYGSNIKLDIANGNTMFIGTDKKLYMNGTNSDGQIGNGTTTDLEQITKIDTAEDIVKIGMSGGDFPTFIAMTSDNNIMIWGYNTCGQCGTGNVDIVKTITKLDFVGKDKVKDFRIAGTDGNVGVAILSTDNIIYVAGYCEFGNIGIGNFNKINSTFKKIQGLSNVTIKDFNFYGKNSNEWGIAVLYDNGSIAVCGSNKNTSELGIQVEDMHDVARLIKIKNLL